MAEPSSGAPGPSRLPAGFALFCLAAFALQLWLAVPDEVVSSPNRYDQLRYLEMADEISRGRWLGPYGPLTLVREPGYPLWLALVSGSGLRLRVAAELLLAAAAFGFAAALLRLGASRAIAAASFAVLVLQPHGFLMNREVLPASFYLPVLLVALMGLLLAVRSRRPAWRFAHAAWAGLAFGVLWVTRPETFVISGVLVWAAGAELLARRREPARVLLRDAALLLVVPACLVAGVAGAVSALNRRHYGVWIVSERRAPGNLAAQRALRGIEHAAPRRFVPVPADVRARSYAVSPAFRRLEPELEGPSWARNVSCVQTRVCRDLAAGVLPWIVREAAAAAGELSSAPAADAFFRRVADEIDAACEAGELSCRHARSAFLHPYPQTWLPHVAGSLRRIAARMATAGTRVDRRPPRDDASLAVRLRHRFDRVANRRPELTSYRWVEIEGYADSADPVTRVALLRGAERIPPAVVGPVGEGGGARVGFAFRFERPFAPEPPRRSRLEIERASGERTRVELSSVLSAPLERDGVRIAIDRITPLEPASGARRGVRDALWSLHALWIRGLSGLGLVAAALWIACRSGRGAASGIAVAVLAAVVASRLLLLVVVDASAFPTHNSRYLYPVISLYSCTLLLVIDAALAGWRRKEP